MRSKGPSGIIRVFGKKKKKIPATSPTVFGREIVFEGDLVCSSSLNIRGRFSGSISSTKDIVTEKASELSLTSLTARGLVIKGMFAAESVDAESVELQASARVQADMKARSFCAAGGARLSGRLDMESSRRGPGSSGSSSGAESAHSPARDYP